MNTTITRRPGRYARTTTTSANPSRHTIEISAGPGSASYGEVESGQIKIWPAATAPCHLRRAVAR